MTAQNLWESQGFGTAPFRCVGMFQMPNKETATMFDYQALPRMSRGGVGSCHVCGTGIIYNYIIKDACGETFVVGCDCVGHTGDQTLIKEAKAKRREVKDAIRTAEYKKRAEERAAALAIEREKNVTIVRETYGELFDKCDALNLPWVDDIIQSCLKWGHVSEKQAAALQKALDRAAEKAARKNEFFGVVGERIEAVLTVEMWKNITQPGYAPFGQTYLVKLRDEEGRSFIYFGNSNAIPNTGETVKLKFGVKEHSVYDGVNQTVIQRPTVSKK